MFKESPPDNWAVPLYFVNKPNIIFVTSNQKSNVKILVKSIYQHFLRKSYINPFFSTTSFLK